ncbi:MAG TPA: glycosyltransferase [Pseudomonadales bacterium]
MTNHADKKVVLLSGSLKLSGSTTWIINLHRGLRQLGVDVIHIVTNRPGQEILPDDLRVFYTGAMDKRLLIKLARAVRLHRLAPACYQALLDRLYNRAVAGILAQLGWQDSVDRVIKDFTAYLPPLLARYPLISTIHQKLSLNWHSARLRQHASEPAVFIAVSQSAMADARQLQVPVSQVIYNPIDAGFVSSRATEFEPDEAGYVVFVGSLNTGKGVYSLLEAMQFLPAHIRLLYVGSGPEEAGLRRRAISLGIEGRVRFQGFVDNPYPYINNASVLVLPSRSEAMPYVPIEATLLSTPVVVSDFDGVEEFFEAHGIVNQQPEGEFPRKLAEAIETVIEKGQPPVVKTGILEQMAPTVCAEHFVKVSANRPLTH